MNLTGFDYYANKPDQAIGLTRTATLIRAARREAGDDLVLLFDNGDSLQGTPLGDWAAHAPQPHPALRAFDALGYDAIGLGNHDFGFGLDVLDHILSQATCPVLCSNLTRTEGRQSWVRSTVLTRTIHVAGQDKPIRIGVLSVLPPQTTHWEAHLLNDKVQASDILRTAGQVADELRDTGCDLVVALAHCGLGPTEAAHGLENAVIPLAALAGIDTIIAGHTHLTLPGPGHEGLTHVDHVAGLVHETPVVMPGSAGSHLGIIDLELEVSADGRIHLIGQAVALRRSDDSVEDPEISRLFEVGHTETQKIMARPVAKSARDMHSYFSFCAPDRGLALVAAAQAAALRSLLSDTEWTGLPLISAVSPYKYGGRAGPRHYTEVPAGEICLRHVADLHVFPNELRAVLINGQNLLDWLEMSAGAYHLLPQRGESELIDSRRAGYNFDVIFGLSYQIDPASPARFDSEGHLTDPGHRRILNLKYDGQAVRPDQSFLVALNNYRASGGGHFPFVRHARQIALPPLGIKGILRDYLSKRLPRDPLEQSDYPFSLTPQGGRHTILKTGPGALRYLAELNAYDPLVLAPDADGFERIRLTL